MKHLIQFSLLLTAYLLFFSSSLLAQNPERTKTIPITRDSAYTKIIQVLQDGGYFISNLDRPSGFIQINTYLENNKLLTLQEDKKLIFNFLISPIKDGGSKVVLKYIFNRTA